MASSSTPLAPQILSRAALPSLIQSLDASDVLECYHLTRHAPLHMQDDNHNSTRIVVTKSAIGLRYQGRKQPLQLTLEYGPQRVGDEQTEEATPLLSTNYMTWQNEAKVYYTLHLIPGEWNAAQYMASITGAVLEKLLQQAVAYVEVHRRYQPFVVVTNTTKTLLKSSSSHDFLQNTWEFLATLGVELQPLLPPRVFVARLHVDSVEKVASGDVVVVNDDTSTMVVSQDACNVYTKLQQCVTAIATGDYSRYEPNESVAPTMTPTTMNSSSTVDDDVDDTTEEESPPPDEQDDESPPRRRLAASVVSRWIQEDDIENAYGDNDVVLPTTTNTLVDNDQQDDTTTSSTPAPSTSLPLDTINEAEEANKAAQEAKDKAHEAKEAANTVQDEKAANAAEAAANAAEKAAHVTSQKQQQVAQTNLLSGNGELMTSSLRTCFTNSQYQLVDKNGSALLYLYLDGATYYRLNLTMPYIDVMQVNRPIPQPPLTAGSGGGDFVDWTLALVTIGFLLVGIVLVFQRIGFKFLPPLYNLQKWFFSPTESGYDNEEEEAMKMGQGFEHAFGEDVIPFSMGGRRPGLRQRRQVLPELYIDTSNGHDEHDTGDVEMVGDALVPASLRGRSMSSDGLGSRQSGSNHSSGRRLSGPIIMEIPERLSRDPDLVDLPNLSSRSKVAVPVSIEQQQQSRNASDAGGSADDDPLDSSQEGSFA